MMKVKKVSMKFLVVFGLLFGSFVFWKTNFPSGTWRYKVIVEIETPEGIKSGYAVREVTAVTQPSITPETHPVTYGVIGEAVAIDLGDRGVAFALLGYTEVFKAFPKEAKTTKEFIQYYSNLPVGQKAVLTSAHPQIVTFTDINDPLTVKMVLGSRFNVKKQDLDPVNDFEALFGQGVTLKQVIIEITDEPVTWDIEKWLPWLDRINGGYLDGAFLGGGPELSNILDGEHFKRESKYKKERK
ncbi:MAG: hypothetical protein KA099_09425 [Alphaproteobacteria bacterium]|nr:hypothetical protein [Alphaproteobacteria bacterium]MBP7762323.1 hypothetical protein [Alphaproteobacteria bacterium]MBP7905533.1 hypothetical protein [Alphaproteobacteria bacterium]